MYDTTVVFVLEIMFGALDHFSVIKNQLTFDEDIFFKIR